MSRSLRFLQCEGRARRRQLRLLRRWTVDAASILTLAGSFLMLASCGGGGSSSDPNQATGLSGNWQFSLTTTGTTFSVSPLQGGFLQQSNGSFSGQVGFSIALANGTSAPTICNAGTATVTGTVSNQTIGFTAVVGTLDNSGNPTTQTITLSGGTLSSNGTTIQNGTYSLTAGYYYPVGSTTTESCGAASDAGTWSATLVPPLSGSFQGFFHSGQGNSLEFQDFAVSGTLTQGPNIGASSATVTGTLSFIDPTTSLNDYPCLSGASVNGTISGNTVLLQMFASNGADAGQIGQTPGDASESPVTLQPTQGGFVLQEAPGLPGYRVTTKPCPGSPGDSGNLCLAFGGTNACKQPISLTPFFLTFVPQLLGSTATTQTVTLSNVSGAALTGLTLSLPENDSDQFYGAGGGDFNGVPHFTEQDTCGGQTGLGNAKTFNLDAAASCTITVAFSPQESCPWLPSPASQGIDSLAPAQCPIALSAGLTLTLPKGTSADTDNTFVVPITGTGMSFIVPSVPELDFGAEAVGEASPPQTVTFTNQSLNPVRILESLPASSPSCVYSIKGQGPPLDRPPVAGVLGGVQVAANPPEAPAPISPDTDLIPPLIDAPTVRMDCDIDPPLPKGSGNPNFLISNDECSSASGVTLQPFGQPGDSCSIEVTFVPQPHTWGGLALANGTGFAGLDDFLQLNSDWCGDANNSPQPDCEIDSGRFPVEMKTNGPSPLRMTPGAGMDFGIWTKGTASTPLSITLFNDPADPNAGPVTITNKATSNSDYSEVDDCPASLPTNSSCTITVTFTPDVTTLDPGTIEFTYSLGSQVGFTQFINMRGSGCSVLSTGVCMMSNGTNCTVLPSGECVTQGPAFRRRHEGGGLW